MIDITLGRYWKGSNPISRYDSRVKMVFLLVYIASLFYFSGIPTIVFSACVLISVIILSRIPLSYITKGLLKPFLLFVFFALLIALIEEDGIKRALIMLTRLTLTVLSSTMLSLTTRPLEIAAGIEKSLGKGKLKRSVRKLSTIIMIAFRFLPILVDEANRITDAQKSRGCSFEGKGIVKKCRATLPLLVPLFASAFRRADALALAMDARGYNSEGSTSLKPLHYTKRDIVLYLFVFLYASICFSLEKFLYI